VILQGISEGHQHTLVVSAMMGNKKTLLFFRLTKELLLLKKITLNDEFPSSIKPLWVTCHSESFDVQGYRFPLFEGDRIIQSYWLQFKGKQVRSLNITYYLIHLFVFSLFYAFSGHLYAMAKNYSGH